MGACVSRQKLCCFCLSSSSSKRRRNGKGIIRKRRIIKRRVSSKNIDKNEPLGPPERSNGNTPTQGNIDFAWSDAISVLESERDDEFYSVNEDGFSLIGSESASVPSVSSPRGCRKSFHRENSTPENLVGEVVNEGNTMNAQLKDENSELKRKDGVRDEEGNAVSVDEMSNLCVEGQGHGMLNCGILPNTCLPCLAASSVPAVDTKSPAMPHSKRWPSLKLSFKLREGHATPTLDSPKVLLQRPIAGASVPYCPTGKKMANCWYAIEPGTYKVRGPNYFRDKKKGFAPNCAAFYPFGVDVFLSPRKIHHIARFVELPPMSVSSEVPAILIVNVQIPLYPASIFQNEYDGEGGNLVMYFKLSESYSKELPLHFQENLIRFLNDEVERVKGFPMDSIVTFRERLKILGRLANVDEVHLSTAERAILNSYYEKPLMSRPQHEFYLGENYFEIDLDMHRYCYLARKGLEALKERLKFCVLDFGLTIQGNKPEEVPENVLCCLRLSKVDYTKYHYLGC